MTSKWVPSLSCVAVVLVMVFAIGCSAPPPIPGAPGAVGAPGAAGPPGPPGPAGAPGKAAAVPPGPGLKLEITKVQIGADNKPVVSFKLTDDKGNPVKPTDVDAGSLRFGIARIAADKESGLTRYESFLVNDVKGAEFTVNGQKKAPAQASAKQAQVDAGAKVTETELGYAFTFTNTLPANFDKSATLVVGGQVTRNARQYAANDVYAFVPAGGTPITREVVKTESCNQCHDPLEGHGGQRVETGLCVVCHTPQTIDPESGNTVDFKVMVHKLHAGKDLPSVKAGKPYQIVGYRQNVVDFSAVGWPQDTRNCTTCHAGAKDGDNWKNAPSAAACTSCHDDVNLQTGQNHRGGPQTNDASCKGCHPPDSGKEFDASVAGAHTLPNNSKQLRGVKFEIVSVSDTKPGQKPVVTFNIKDKAGKLIDPKEMAYLGFTLAGPTTDYANRWTDTVVRAPSQPSTAKDAGGGNFQYTFQNPIPADATGTYAVGIEGYLAAELKKADGTPLLGPDKKPLAVRDAGFNQVLYAPVTDAKATPRRAVVKRDNCNQCHQDLGNPAGLSIHGGMRRNTEYCILCHTPTASDAEVRPADKGAPTSIQFKYLIHRIHTGEEQDTPYLVYGRGGSLHDFSEVLYPGNRANCVKCHQQGTFLLPLPKTALPTTVSAGGRVVSVTAPVAATCTGCHDSSAVKGHAELNTTADKIETCTVCHGPGKDFAVDQVHK